MSSIFNRLSFFFLTGYLWDTSSLNSMEISRRPFGWLYVSGA